MEGALLIIGALMTNIIPCVLCIRTRNKNGVDIDEGGFTTQNNERGSAESNNSDMVQSRDSESKPTESFAQNGTRNIMSRDLEAERSGLQREVGVPLLPGNHLMEARGMVHLDHTLHDDSGGSGVIEGAGCSHLGNYRQADRPGYSYETHGGNSSSEEPSDSILSQISMHKETRNGRSSSRTESPYDLPKDGVAAAHDDDYNLGRSDESSIRNRKFETKTKQNKCESKFLEMIIDMIEAFRSTPFYTDPWGNLVYICLSVFGFVYSGWHAFLVPHALERGISPFYVLVITAFAAFGNFSGRISAGILTNSLVYPSSLFLVLCSVNSLLLLAYTYITNYFAMAVLSCLSAGSVAGRALIPLLVAKDRTSPDKYHYVYGASQMSVGAGLLLGGLISGLAIDHLSSYDAAFRLLAAVEVGAFFLMLPLRLMRSPQQELSSSE